MSYFLVILFMSFLVSSVNANNESIEKAIAASDPIALRYAIIQVFPLRRIRRNSCLILQSRSLNTTYMGTLGNQKSVTTFASILPAEL